MGSERYEIRDSVDLEPKPQVEVAEAVPAPEPVAEAEDKPAEEGSSEEESTEPKKRKGGYQRKLDRQRAETEYWRNLALSGQPAQVQKPEPEAAAEPEAKPSPEAFETHEEYVLALMDWREQKREKAEAEKREAEKAKKEGETIAVTFKERWNQAQQEIDDFEEVMADSEAPMTAAMREAIVTSEIGPKIAYHLAKHPEDAVRIAGLSPLAAARELGRIEAALSKPSEPETKPKPITKAPAPIAPASGRSAPIAAPKTSSRYEYY